METSEATRTTGKGRPALRPGQVGQIQLSGWIKDPITGTPRRRRPEDSSRRPALYFTAECYLGAGPGQQPKRMQARGKTRTEAAAALTDRIDDQQREALHDAMGTSDRITNADSLRSLLDGWMTSAEAGMAVGTRIRYRQIVTSTCIRTLGELGPIGDLRIDQLTAPVLAGVLQPLTPAVRKSARGVLRAALDYATAHGADAPARSGSLAALAIRTSKKGHPSVATERADFTRAEGDAILALVDADQEAQRADIADLLFIIARTGVRLGEALALRWDDVDLTRGTMTIAATVNAVGARQERTKTSAGRRTISIPPGAVERLLARRSRHQHDALVFASTAGTPRWTSNVTTQIRRVLDRLDDAKPEILANMDLKIVSARSWRRSAATILNASGLSDRQVADHLGHSKISTTLDVYVSRMHVGPAGAADLL